MADLKKRVNKKTLPPFGFSWYRVPEYLAQANEEIEALQISNTLVFRSTLTSNNTTSGNLVVGKEYVIYTLETGDDFSNVGFVTEGVPFIATGTTPTDWTNETEVSFTVGDIFIMYNDLDPAVNIYYDLSDTIITDTAGKIVIETTNGLFDINKVFPSTGDVVIVSNNKIASSVNGGTEGYFKFDIYV